MGACAETSPLSVQRNTRCGGAMQLAFGGQRLTSILVPTMRKLKDSALADGSLGPSLLSGSISRWDARVPWASARKTSVSDNAQTREWSVVYNTAGKGSPPTRLSTYVP